MSSLPTPLRAALGLALTVVDAARENATTLPQKAAGLPVALASQAVQVSLRAQQQYAAYVVKGDELIGTFRGAPDEAPDWATFDGDATATPARNTAFDRVPDAEAELDEDDAVSDLTLVADDIEDAEADSGADDAVGAPDPTAALDQLERRRPGRDAVDLLEGRDEGTPTSTNARRSSGPSRSAAAGTVGADGIVEEVIGEDAPRTTAPREPRKSARKAARKTTARKTAPRSTPGTAAIKTPRTTPAAKKASGRGSATPRGTSPSTLPPSPDSDVSDTQPPAE